MINVIFRLFCVRPFVSEIYQRYVPTTSKKRKVYLSRCSLLTLIANNEQKGNCDLTRGRWTR
jgi:hypothetical protein